MWVCATVTAIIVGKLIIYELLFNAIFKIKLFSKGQGLWICLFLTLIVSLYIWSLIYNEIIVEIPELHSYKITNEMNITFKTFMKGVATISFLTHFILTLMITDTVMQVKQIEGCVRYIFASLFCMSKHETRNTFN